MMEKKETDKLLPGTESKEVPSRQRTVYFIPGFKDHSSMINFQRQITEDGALIIGREGKKPEADYKNGSESFCFEDEKENCLFKGNETEDCIHVNLNRCLEMMAQEIMTRTTSIDSGIDCTHINVCDESQASIPVGVRAPLASPDPDINCNAQNISGIRNVRKDITESDKQPANTICEESDLPVKTKTSALSDQLLEYTHSIVDNSCGFGTLTERTNTGPKSTGSANTIRADLSKNGNIEEVSKFNLFSKLKRTKKTKCKCSKEEEKGDRNWKNEITELKYSLSVFGKFRLSRRRNSKTLHNNDGAQNNKELCQSQTTDHDLAGRQIQITGDTDRTSHSKQLSYVQTQLTADTSKPMPLEGEKSKNSATNRTLPSAFSLHSPHRLVKPVVKYKENLLKLALSKAFLLKSQSKLPTSGQSAFTNFKKMKVSKSTGMINSNQNFALWDNITDSNSDDSFDSDQNEDHNHSFSSDDDDFGSASKIAKSDLLSTCKRQHESLWDHDNSSDESESEVFYESKQTPKPNLNAKKKSVSKSYDEKNNSIKNYTCTKADNNKFVDVGDKWDSDTDTDSDSSGHSQSFSLPNSKVIQNEQIKRHEVYEKFRDKKLCRNNISCNANTLQSGLDNQYTDSEEFSSLVVERPTAMFSVSESSAFQPYRQVIDGTEFFQDQSNCSLDDSCVLQTYSSDLFDANGHSSDLCESSSSLDESPNTLTQYTVGAHSSKKCIVDTFPLSPCLKRSWSLKEKMSTKFLPQPCLATVDDIDVHCYASEPELKQGRIYGIMDCSSNQREKSNSEKHPKNLSFGNEPLCSRNLCRSSAQSAHLENDTNDNVNYSISTTKALHTELIESDLCRKILDLYFDIGDEKSSPEITDARGKSSPPGNLDSSPVSSFIQEYKCSPNTKPIENASSLIPVEYSTAKFVPTALQRTQAKMRRIPSFAKGSENDGVHKRKHKRSSPLDCKTRKSILKEKTEKPNVEKGVNSSEELEKMTKIHTFLNGERQVKFINFHNINTVVKDFPPPKLASRINWSDRLVDVSCRDYSPRNTPTKPRTILQKKSEKFVYPYTDDVPSPILITRLRRSKSSRRYREWPW